MMQIEWRLEMGAALEPENLVGDITLSEAQTSFGERDTYIDSWLEALITGLQAVQMGQRRCVDIPEEVAALVFTPVDQGVQIAYRTMVLHVESIDELQRAVYVAAQALLQRLATVEGWETNPLLRGIGDFVCQARATSGALDI